MSFELGAWTIVAVGLCTIALLVDLGLRRTVREIDGDPALWVGKGLPTWAWFVIGLYVTLAIGAIALFARSYLM